MIIKGTYSKPNEIIIIIIIEINTIYAGKKSKMPQYSEEVQIILKP